MIVNLGASGINYVAGDSLGVVPKNFPDAVDELLGHLRIDPETSIEQPKGGALSLRELLLTQYIINRVSKKFVKAVLEKLPEGEAKTKLTEITGNEEAFNDYTFARDYTDVLIDFPVQFEPLEVLPLFNKIAPRLYSIASSPKAHPGEVHLTVAVVSYHSHGRTKYGLATGYLCHLQELNVDSLPVYIQPTKHFHMPAPDKDIIMVGPGTGIAPFRALPGGAADRGRHGQELALLRRPEKGDRLPLRIRVHRDAAEGSADQNRPGVLRDQAQKVYVQDRIRENGRSSGSGCRKAPISTFAATPSGWPRMSTRALIEVAQTHGGLSPEAATEYIEVTLAKTEKRYLKDVYLSRLVRRECGSPVATNAGFFA